MSTFDVLKEKLTALAAVPGITPVEILELPDVLHNPVRKMLKRSLTGGELAAELNLPVEEASQLADILVNKGFLVVDDRGDDGIIRYRVALARMRTHNIPLDL